LGPPVITGMGPTQRIRELLQRLPISAILGARILSNWCIGGMNLKSAGEQLHSRKPDSCEIHPTPHRDWQLPTEQVQCTQLPTYERMDRWVDGAIM